MTTNRSIAAHVAILTTLLLTAIGCHGGPETGLMSASRNGDLAAVRSAIQRGEPVNARDFNGLTALHWAAKKGQPDAIRLLIKEGKATVDSRDEDRQTPLMLACKWNQPEAAKALIAAGADVNAKEIDRWTPLHFAARSGSPDIAKLLLDKGADPAVRADEGTAYDVAIDEGNHDIADLIETALKKRGIVPLTTPHDD